MAELNVKELEKKLKQARISVLLKDKNSLSAALISGVSITSSFITDITPLKILLAFVGGAELQTLKKYWDRTGIVEEKVITAALENTENYKLCLEEYDKYITDIAELIKEVGINNSKDAVSYLHLLLTSGHFSKFHTHQYKKHQYESENLVRLSGARVLTGKTVCRHQASFITDVLNKLGYTAANMAVIATEYNPIKLARVKNLTYNHAVVSVLDKKGFYLFDPTNGLFSGKPTSISFKEPESILVSEYLRPNQEKPKYLVMNPNSNPLNRDIEENFKKIMTSPQERINKTQTELAQTKSEIIYRGNTQNQ